MELRNEKAVGTKQISGLALKSLRKFHNKKVETLNQRIRGYSLLLNREKNPQERIKIARSIAEWQKEKADLYDAWKRSEIRKRMAEDMPSYAKMQDDLFRKDKDIERKYDEAGRRIARLKASIYQSQ